MKVFSSKNPYGEVNARITKAILLLILSLIVVPVAVIFALNVLFGLGIALTWKTWIATIILLMVINSPFSAAT